MDSHQYAGIPLHLTLDTENKKITAMTQHQQNLVVAIDPFSVYFFPLEYRNNTIIQSAKHKEIKKRVNDICISELCSFDNTLLVFVQGKSTKGLLYTLQEDGKLTKIIDNVNCFAVNQYANEKYILVGFMQKIFLYKFNPEKKCSLCPGYPKELEAKIESVSISFPYSIILTPEKMYSMNLNDYSLKVSRSRCVPAPCTIALSHEFFFTHYALSSMKINRNLSSNISPISFDQEPIDHAYNGSLIATMMPNNINIYNFEGYRGNAYVTDPVHIIQFNEYFIYSTKQGIYYLSEITSQIDDITSGFISENVNLDTDTILSIFEQLWLSDKKDYALTLIKFEKTQSEVLPKILQIFDFFVLPFEGKPFMEPGVFNKEEIYNLLFCELDTLNLFQPDQIEYVNTAKFELLAEMNNLQVLSSFLEKNSNMRMQKEMIEEYYQKAESRSQNSVLSSYPYFLIYLGKVEEALNEFLKTNDYDEYSSILIQKASDFNFVQEKLDILIKNAPLKAIDVLTCDQISSQKSIDLVKKKYPMYLIPVLRKIIDHKGIIDREEIANFYVSQVIALITNINKLKSTPTFDRTPFKFTNSVINNPNASADEIKDEINEMLCDFVIKYRQIIDPSILIDNISSFSSANLKFEIYKASKEYDQAFQLLSENEEDYSKCEEFIGNEEDPQILNHFLLFVKNNLENKKYPKIENFPKYVFESISKFIGFADIDNLLGLIDGDYEVNDNNNNNDNQQAGLLDFIGFTYVNVNKQRMNTEIKAAFAESEEFESLYDRTILESKCVTLNSEMICSHCNNPLGYRFVQLAPDGTFYHNKCLNKTKRKSTL